MNILYFCNVHKAAPTEFGVLKKVEAQCNVLREAGNNVILACLNDIHSFVYLDKSGNILHNIELDKISKWNRWNRIIKETDSFIKKNDINLVYSRLSMFSFNVHRFYKKLKNENIPVLLEIPTYPINQRWTSIRQSLKAKKYYQAACQLYGSTFSSIGILFFKHSVNRIVNNNGFDKIWGIPVIQITNGIDVNSIPIRQHIDHNDNTITLMSVANVAHWHGYDRIITGLHEYYKKKREITVIFELVGPGIEVELLKQLAIQLGVSQYVNFYGPLVGNKLDNLFNKADIGVSVLGVHRNRMKRCDSLKSREFCARQLPFITEEAETQYLNKEFALCVPSNDYPIKIEDILEFYCNIKESPEIMNSMRDYAKKECDWRTAFLPVVTYIKKLEQYD